MKKNFCSVCGKSITRNEIGITRKLVDDGAKEYYCLSCLAGILDVTEDDLKAKIEDFKQEGCKMFS